MEREIAIRVTGVTKRYRLGQIGGGTLTAQVQSRWAKFRGREDPNRKIGEKNRDGEEFFALKGIDLTVYKGEVLGVIGRNGAGKSTLLKLLSRITTPTTGKIQLYGRVSSMLEVGTGFHGELTGRENVYLNGAILGMTRQEIDRKLPDIIAFSEVGEFIDTPVKRYSSGMYVKLAFAVAAHLDSEILIMDEVLAVGDMAFQKKCMDRMRRAGREGRTVLCVSHNMSTIRRLCDRCIVLDRGRVIFDGDVDRAIGLYLGMGTEERVNHCADAPREPICAGGVRMEEIGFEYPRLAIKFSAERDFPKLLFRLILFSAGEPVGMMTSKGYIPTQKGKNTVTLTLFPAGLAPGTYTGRAVLYEVNEYGGETVRDVVDPAFTFRRENDAPDDTTQIWKSHAWGHIHFPSAEVCDENDEALRLLCP